MKKIALFISLILLLSSGCKKYINDPDDTLITTDALFTSSKDLDNLLYGAYGALCSGSTLASNWKVFPEILADNVIVNSIEVLPNDPYNDLYNRNMVVAQYADNWKQAYIAIQNANTVIYAIQNNLITIAVDPQFNTPTHDRILGEALFIRALCNFELVRFYGQQYGYNSTAANSGIVLKTEATLNVTQQSDITGSGRATVDEVYKSIITDLKTAETLLPVTPVRRGRATVYAASAYLARVYFQQNDFTNAMAEISKVIGSTPGAVTTQFSLVRLPVVGNVTAATALSNVLAPYNSASISAQVTETIFDLVSVTADIVSGPISRKYLQNTSIQPHLAVSNTFLANAAYGATDARKLGLFTTVGTKTYSKKYDRAGMNIPIIRSAELLLDRAEINAMNAATNPQALIDATKDINLIRDRAIPAYSAATVISVSVILSEVRRERLRELCFEGDRLHDLRRQNAVVGPGDRTDTTPYQWNSNKLLFKIPDAEIKANPKVIQNPD